MSLLYGHNSVTVDDFRKFLGADRKKIRYSTFLTATADWEAVWVGQVFTSEAKSNMDEIMSGSAWGMFELHLELTWWCGFPWENVANLWLYIKKLTFLEANMRSLDIK